MATLVKNRTSVPDCKSENKDLLSDRISENADIEEIQGNLERFRLKIAGSADLLIKEIKRATSFPIEDISRILANSPDCKYLRVYHGFNSNNEFVTYLAPIKDNFDTYIKDSPDTSIISVCCCQCNPCTLDVLLNPE